MDNVKRKKELCNIVQKMFIDDKKKILKQIKTSTILKSLK